MGKPQRRRGTQSKASIFPGRFLMNSTSIRPVTPRQHLPQVRYSGSEQNWAPYGDVPRSKRVLPGKARRSEHVERPAAYFRGYLHLNGSLRCCAVCGRTAASGHPHALLSGSRLSRNPHGGMVGPVDARSPPVSCTPRVGLSGCPLPQRGGEPFSVDSTLPPPRRCSTLQSVSTSLSRNKVSLCSTVGAEAVPSRCHCGMAPSVRPDPSWSLVRWR